MPKNYRDKFKKVLKQIIVNHMPSLAKMVLKPPVSYEWKKNAA